jgi:hypothetical protein
MLLNTKAILLASTIMLINSVASAGPAVSAVSQDVFTDYESDEDTQD